ncbi:TIGR00341 family protein [Mumia sp. Pv 4-285]|uniref:TIGR00341 family protein n=1 Tax=Mumia qirimensis TaxID=3234852 RepID=UPI00351D8591
MIDQLRTKVLPPSQRRTLEELTLELDPGAGDVASKSSAFWTMLVLSGVIASAGVLADSTATVIGAMIIAPLSTPIMGTALAIVKRQPTRALILVAAGSAVVVVIGLLFSFFLPGSYDVHENGQIIGRTSPDVLDLIAAVATGLAGAVGLARRDVAAVLPGVAIAISLVPPLAVVGVCLGLGDVELAIGALLLFLSNLLALVLAGTLVFAALGYAADSLDSARRSARKTRVTLTVLVVAVTVPLVVNTIVTIVLANWAGRVESVAEEWISQVDGAAVTQVETRSRVFVVHVRAAGELPPADDLLAGLEGEVPDGAKVSVVTTQGEEIEAGVVGD